MQKLIFLVAIFVVLIPCGCHCCGVTERYADHIDDCSDRDVTLDRFYCERLDATRWCMNGRCRNCR
ncbi:MAG: hypothetical protein ACK526_00300 [Planctomyces sp.]